VFLKLVPFENKQSSQIGILEELAIGLVTVVVPTSGLTGLNTPMLASNSTFLHGDFGCKAHPVAIPEKRAFAAAFQGGCLLTAPVAYSEAIKLCRELLDLVV
jgi:hypothetical protein